MTRATTPPNRHKKRSPPPAAADPQQAKNDLPPPRNKALLLDAANGRRGHRDRHNILMIYLHRQRVREREGVSRGGDDLDHAQPWL